MIVQNILQLNIIFIRESIQKGEIQLEYHETQKQLSNILIKALPK